MTKADQRAKLIAKQMQEIWSSLDSHLDWMYNRSKDGKRFHKKCVKDYAKQLAREADLL